MGVLFTEHRKIMARLINFAAAALLVVLVLPGSRHPALALNNSTSHFLRPQNAARSVVGVGKLAWDADLAAYAHRYAEKRAHDCSLVHSRGPYGENIYRCSAGGRGGEVGRGAGRLRLRKQPVRAEARLRALHPGGLGRHEAPRRRRDGGAFVVCSYDPPGNVNGEAPYRVCGSQGVRSTRRVLL
ncbi:hypothetical protein QOZ80_6AG0524460 [Eleusine coracana subsp. coracana]|nr:hypothetical protein QOZ80_6AG0524460 [Eleusine coracana subsp. coracana]